MQSKWNTCPQVPKAILRPFSLFGEGFAYVRNSLIMMREIKDTGDIQCSYDIRRCELMALINLIFD